MRTILVAAIPGLAGCGSVLRNPKADELLEKYQDGYSSYNSGAEKHNEAVISYRSDEYETVQSLLDEALTHLGEAKTAFKKAQQLAKEVENTDANAIATSAREQTELLIEASNLLKSTAEGFANNNYDSAQQSYDNYKETAAKISNRDLTDPKTLHEVVDQGVFDV